MKLIHKETQTSSDILMGRTDRENWKFDTAIHYISIEDIKNSKQHYEHDRNMLSSATSED